MLPHCCNSLSSTISTCLGGEELDRGGGLSIDGVGEGRTGELVVGC